MATLDIANRHLSSDHGRAYFTANQRLDNSLSQCGGGSKVGKARGARQRREASGVEGVREGGCCWGVAWRHCGVMAASGKGETFPINYIFRRCERGSHKGNDTKEE